MPRRLALIASSLAVAVLLVGCGSDDDSSDDERDTTTTEAEETTSTTETDDEDETTTESTEAPDDETTTESSAPPEDETTTTAADGPGDPEFCAAYEAFDQQANDLPDETYEQMQTAAQTIRDGLAGLIEVAPEDLAADVETLAAAGDDLVAAVEGTTTVEDAQTAAAEVFQEEGFMAAIERVDGYFDERCAEANDEQADG